MFVSGLNFDVDSHEAVLKMDVLFDYLAGLGGSPLELEQESKYKTKVFFVGNTFLRYITGEGKHQRTRMDIAQKLDEALDQLSVRNHFVHHNFEEPFLFPNIFCMETLNAFYCSKPWTC